MSTSILGLPNDYAAGDLLPSADVNSLADTLEWVGAGYLSKSVAGGADVTLTESEYEQSVLVLTGLLTANINVILPGHAGRRWVVFNNTTGAFTVTCKTSGGTGIAVTQGKTTLLWGDGTNILIGVNDLTAAGIAASGANGDITSMTGLTGGLRAPTGVLDGNGNEVVTFGSVASAVNEVKATNAATGNAPVLEATGGDTNIDLTIKGKGTGAVNLGLSAGKHGFYGVAGVVRPTAYTQTYSTATRTHSNPTAATLTDNSAGTANTTVQAMPDPADTPASADALRDDLVANLLPALRNNIADLTAQINALITDQANAKQVLNQVIDDLQANGLLQ